MCPSSSSWCSAFSRGTELAGAAAERVLNRISFKYGSKIEPYFAQCDSRAPLLIRIRRDRSQGYGFGSRQTPVAFVVACNRLYLYGHDFCVGRTKHSHVSYEFKTLFISFSCSSSQTSIHIPPSSTSDRNIPNFQSTLSTCSDRASSFSTDKDSLANDR